MFKQRLLTALILIPLVLFAIEKANGWVLCCLMSVVLSLAAYEWLALIPLKKTSERVLFFITLALSTFLCWFAFYPWLWTGLIVWGLLAFSIVTYPGSERFWGNKLTVSLLCLFLVPLVFVSMCAIYMHESGQDLVIYLLFLVWGADTGGYLVGKQWGKHRLIAKVSPGKTYEGALGGFLFTMIVATVGYLWFPSHGALSWFGLACMVAIFSMLGDLNISMLKRRSNLKDTGTLIPGHGGVLDRLDSLIAAAPLFYAGLYLLSGNR
jgi:phosphatidate cytidylyltransferase